MTTAAIANWPQFLTVQDYAAVRVPTERLFQGPAGQPRSHPRRTRGLPGHQSGLVVHDHDMPADGTTKTSTSTRLRPDREAAREMTIVFTDIESSTELTATNGDEGWLDLLICHDDIVEACAAEHGGTIVKSLGDGFMLTFDAPSTAAAFCLDLRRRLDDCADLADIRIRAGIHHGSVIPSRGDFYGTAVNTAARVAGQAIGGQTLVSETVARQLDAECTVPFAHVGLKGLPGTYRLSSLVPFG